MSIFGTRPEAIKMAPVVHRLEECETIESVVCVTGQHRQMLDQVLELFNIRPDYDLSVMTHSQKLNGLTATIINKLDEVFEEVKPDRVLVHGDTTTSMAASLCAFHQGIPVGHVEAGLRTGKLDQPWPEEMNRRVADLVSDLLFAPTKQAEQNLLKENLGTKQIIVTGNTVIDALFEVVDKIKIDQELESKLSKKFPFLPIERKLLLVTGHRRENFGLGFEGICQALAKLAERDDVEIVYPVHLNPNVRQPVMETLGNNPYIHLIEPQEYLPFVYLMYQAAFIITDSGGVQEEAPSLGKPVLVMRDVTERPEAVDAGTVKLVGTVPEKIIQAAASYLDNPKLLAEASKNINPYGDGKASYRILQEVTHGN